MKASRISISHHKALADVNVLIIKDDDTFTAYCPELNLSSYGESIEDAQQAFQEALTIFIQETIRKGTLERELLKLGWTLTQRPSPLYIPPMQSDTLIKMYPRTQKTFTESISIPC